MADNDEVWRWDDADSVRTSGAEAQAVADRHLMEWTGARTPHEAVTMLLGRPSLAEQGHEPSEVLHFKAPASMAAYVKAKHNRSAYLRELIARDMQEHGRQLQDA